MDAPCHRQSNSARRTKIFSFRRALRKPDQLAFDELFAGARKYTAAVALASHALPFEAILLAMVLEEHLVTRSLRQQVEALQQAVERLSNGRHE
jgi:hypothetical protein